MWTRESILSLCPDERSREQALKLADSEYWLEFHADQERYWGRCQSTGLLPYEVSIQKAAFETSCTCPQLQPCRHVLALLLLLCREGDLSPATPLAPPNLVSNTKPLSKNKSLADYQEGLDYLEARLQEVAQRGLAQLEADWWLHAAARLQDLKLSRLSQEWREVESHQADYPQQAAKVLGRAAQIQLLSQSPALSPELEAELLLQLGYAPRKAELIQEQKPLSNQTWLIMGIEHQTQNRGEASNPNTQLHSRILYLYQNQDSNSPNWALVIDYALGPKPSYQRHYETGWQVQTNCYPYWGLNYRVVLDEAQLSLGPAPALRPNPNWTWPQSLDDYAQALSRNPFLRPQPFWLEQVWPLALDEQTYALLDAERHLIPLRDCSARQWWQIQALSGGQALQIMGIWQDQALKPLSLCCDQTWIAL